MADKAGQAISANRTGGLRSGKRDQKEPGKDIKKEGQQALRFHVS